MVRHNLWLGAAAIALVCGCEKKEPPNVDVSPSRPAEPSVEPRNEPLRNDPMANADQPRVDNDKVEPSVQQGGVTSAAAISSIVQARCAREARCNNIGADKKYSSLSECTAKLSESRKDDLNMDDCPRGISQKELGECLAEVKNEDCNNPLDSLGRLAACRSSDLCMATP